MKSAKQSVSHLAFVMADLKICRCANKKSAGSEATQIAVLYERTETMNWDRLQEWLQEKVSGVSGEAWGEALDSDIFF